MPQSDDDKDIRPRPDPTALTTQQLDREIAHLKELMDKDRESQQQALTVALTAMERRLGELNELRKAVESDRSQFVRGDVYGPAHEELRSQREADSRAAVAMASDIKTNATDLAKLENSMMWLSRLVVGALILAIITYAFQRLLVR